METIIFKNVSKKDLNFLLPLAKKMGIEIEKVKNKKVEINENWI